MWTSPRADSRWYYPGNFARKRVYVFDFQHYDYMLDLLEYHELEGECTVEEILGVVIEAFLDWVQSSVAYELIVEEHALQWIASRGISIELGGNRTPAEELFFEGVLSMVQELRQGLIAVLERVLRALNGVEFRLSRVTVLSVTASSVAVEISDGRT